MTGEFEVRVPTRVIHIVESLDTCAVENWLLRMLTHAQARGYALDWTFYCYLDHTGAHEAKARNLGAQVIHSAAPIGEKVAFVRALRKTLREGGYDVIHAHHDLVSGLELLASSGLAIRRRLIQMHNADEFVLTPNPVKQKLFREPLRRLGLALADRVVGISNHTLDTYLAGRARRPGRDIVHYYGVDPAPFAGPVPDRAAFRRELGLPPDALVMLFGGRIVAEKNPVFTVEILAALAQIEPRAVAVFAGAGGLEDEVKERAQALGIPDRIRMIGWRHDLPQVMAASDLFVLPRPEAPMEGFGLAIVEAQLAGLRMLLSTGVPDDPLLPTAQYRRMRLTQPAQAWAAAAAELLAQAAPSPVAAMEALAASPMNMDTALAHLMALHE